MKALLLQYLNILKIVKFLEIVKLNVVNFTNDYLWNVLLKFKKTVEFISEKILVVNCEK